MAKSRTTQMNGTVLEINLSTLRANLNSYRVLLKEKTKIMVMVKAFAYGTGVFEIARFCQREQVDYLGVAYLDEAVEMRRNGINLPIMIMNSGMTDFGSFESDELQAVIYSHAILKRFIASGSAAAIHLELETGMNRLGFSESDLEGLVTLLKNNPKLKVEGIFTHFSSSDLPAQDDYTRQQAEKFDRMHHSIIAALGYSPIRHVLNSPGMIRFPEFHYDMVRLGIGMYGFDPTHSLKIETVATLKTQVSQIKEIKKGESISYSRSGRANTNMTIAILPIGYADGYLRVFGNGKGKVCINEELASTVGSICMDMTIVDITGLSVREGDEVVVFGNLPTIGHLADWSNTIPYEILTNVSQRVCRKYIGE